MKEKGLELIAVNTGDSKEAIQKYVNDSKFTFRIVMGGSGEQYTLGKAYGVQAYPTNYLIDAATGKVIWRGVGFNEAAMRAALAKAGLQ